MVDKDRDAGERALPVLKVAKELLEKIATNETCIIMGETACGKTTQIPPLIHKKVTAGVGGCKDAVIVCTQPRRVAAISVAKRVAEEQKCDLGGFVGYSVRFDDFTSPRTRIKYMTDGMLIREAMLDRDLLKYAVIIIDECHERSIQTDILLGVAKLAQQRRRKAHQPPLKLVIMSATMDCDAFASFFSLPPLPPPPVLYIPGRQNYVTIYSSLQKQKDHLDSSLVTIFKIHRTAHASSHILIFVSGRDEIEYLVMNIRRLSKSLASDLPKIVVRAMYASLPINFQLKAFQTVASDMRKVIVSTNIAETSITIPGILYVIDTGKMKVKCHDHTKGFDTLQIRPISKAQAWQRSGRAGRESDAGTGFCYRLYTDEEYAEMRDQPEPEILRSNLSSLLLQLLAIGVSNVSQFPLISKPSDLAFLSALKQLNKLGAISSKENNNEEFKLTPLGEKLSWLPLDPKLSFFIVENLSSGCCFEDVLALTAMLSVDSPFYQPIKMKDKANLAHSRFHSEDGDHLTLIRVFKAYKSHKGERKKWCQSNFLNMRNLQTALKIKVQLKKVCTLRNLTPKSSGGTASTSLLSKSLAKAFIDHVAEYRKAEACYVLITSGQRAHIHPSSSLFFRKPPYVLFTESLHTSKFYMKCVTLLPDEVIADLFPKNKVQFF